MGYLCRSCSTTFEKKLTLKEKNDRIVPKFCSKDCALYYSIQKTIKINKSNRLPHSSKEEKQFGEMVKSFFPRLEKQYRIKNYDHHYDFYSPELNIIIEYNGEYWHNKPKNRIKDKKHLKEATKQKIPVAIITDREWKMFIDSGLPDRKKLLKLLNHSIKNLI